MKKLLIVIGLVAFASFAATAASFSYQGVLKTAEGNEVKEKNQTITFRLYDKAESELTQALWGRKVSVLLDKDGLFNVELSDAAGSAVEGLTSTLDQVLSQYGNSTLYIGLEVEKSSGEIRPRQKVLAVPTASFAQDVKTARGDFSIAGNATICGSLEISKNLSVLGDTKIQKLTADKASLWGETTIASLTVGGDAEITGGLSVQGHTVFATIPSGVIVAWNGNSYNIPEGWALCDGRQGRPDLTDHFIMGGDASGGERTIHYERGDDTKAWIRCYYLCYIIKL